MRAILGLLLICPLLTGCYIKGSIEDMDSAKKAIQMNSAIEVNSGSASNVTTSAGYKVSHAVGNLSSEVATKTQDNYQVFMSVQGSVFSEDVEQQQQ